MRRNLPCLVDYSISRLLCYYYLQQDIFKSVILVFITCVPLCLMGLAQKENMDSRYALIETRMGWLGILGSPTGLRHLVLPQTSAGNVLSLLGEGLQDAEPDIASFGDLPSRLVEYFRGETVSFPDLMDLAGATHFQCAVWKVTRSISYGQTRSYSWVARQIGIQDGARAVGQALARNPLPVIVPCHRVIAASGGKLAGFSYGLEMKRHMLQMEARGTLKL